MNKAPQDAIARKTCKTCGTTHPKTSEFFYTTTVKKPNGAVHRVLRPECKGCSVESAKRAKHVLGDANTRLRRGMGGSKACRRWMLNVLGYSAGELVAHLEAQFTKGMTLERLFLGEIHIDHIVPIRCFDKNSEADMKVCYGLPNLRPLWASDNLAKSGARTHLL